MVWAGKTDFDSAFYGASIWVSVYLASGTGASTTSVNGGTISDTRNWMDFVDDFAAIGCRMLEDDEFQAIASGSNEETNITGSADPGTTTGHVDTAGRRMVSHIGCEDCCGALWQWLRTQSYRSDGVDWTWENLSGAKGSLYKQGTYGDVKLLAGGTWSNGAICGSRCRHPYYSRWGTDAAIAGRFCAESS
jgi:formylglycine-generating enzyme required for sulfatase activity